MSADEDRVGALAGALSILGIISLILGIRCVRGAPPSPKEIDLQVCKAALAASKHEGGRSYRLHLGDHDVAMFWGFWADQDNHEACMAVEWKTPNAYCEPVRECSED